MAKEKVTVTIDPELLKWVDAEVRELIFSDRSHAVNFALKKLKDERTKR